MALRPTRGRPAGRWPPPSPAGRKPPVLKHRADALADMRAKLLDDSGDKSPRDAGRHPQDRRPVDRLPLGLIRAGSRTRAGARQPRRHEDRQHHAAADDQPGRPPQRRRGVRPPARRRRRAEEEADPAGHSHRRQPVPCLYPPVLPHGGHHRQVGEDEQQLRRQDRLNQRQRSIGSATTWSPNPASMLEKPSSHTGWRASRNTSQGSKPVTLTERAPSRWHTEEVAVKKLAATESSTASSIRARFAS